MFLKKLKEAVGWMCLDWILYEGDCFNYLPSIGDGSVDMVLCDLPYGTTQCRWDTPLPLDKLWKEYLRVIKDNGAIVLTASQPFTSHLVVSNPKLFRYEWVWDKVNRYTGFLDANRKPLKKHENVLVFSKKQTVYNPIFGEGNPYITTCKVKPDVYSNYEGKTTVNNGTRFPHSIISIEGIVKTEMGLHPTQKPVALFEYLIRTYTNPGDLVLDNCAGSGTTGVACYNTGRRCIMIEKEPEYCEIIRQRMREVTSQTRLVPTKGVVG